jgi:Na+-driven multidrug efflux pump
MLTYCTIVGFAQLFWIFHMNEQYILSPGITSASTSDLLKDIPLNEAPDDHITISIPTDDGALIVAPNVNNDDYIFNHKLLALSEAIKMICSFAWPIVLPRFLVVGNTLLTVRVFEEIGVTTAAAGAICLAVVAAVFGTIRGGTGGVGIQAGNIYGRYIQHVKDGNLEAAGEELKNIGRLSRQGTVLGLLAVIPASAILLSIGPLARGAGIDADVAAEIESFLQYSCLVAPPLFLSFIDQQLFLAIGAKFEVAIAGLAYTLVNCLGPLVLAPRLGIIGFPVATTMAAWTSFLTLRAFFFKEKYNPYHLIDCSFKGVFNKLSELIKLGLPLCFQSFTEWFNLAILAFMVGKVGNDAAIAAFLPLQTMAAGAQLFSAIFQAMSIKMTQEIGKLKVVCEKINGDHHEYKTILSTNIKRFAQSGHFIGGSIALFSGLLITVFRDPITSAFYEGTSISDDDITLLQGMLIYAAIANFLDIFRTFGGAALAASKDLLFAPILSALTMSILGLTVGGSFSLLLDWGADWLFITRDAGILLAAIGIAYRLYKKNYVDILEAEVGVERHPQALQRDHGLGRSCCSFFSRSTVNRGDRADEEALAPLVSRFSELNEADELDEALAPF